MTQAVRSTASAAAEDAACPGARNAANPDVLPASCLIFLAMTPWGYLGSGTLLAVVATIAVVSGLAAGQDSSDAMWLFVGIGVVLAVVALPLIMIGAVAKGRRVSEITSR
jgi:hypothetical protein